METKKIIEELELNYGYKFNPKEKHEFNWLCNLVKDVETVVSKNELLHIVSDMFSFSAYLECYYSYWDNTELGDITHLTQQVKNTRQNRFMTSG